MPIPQIKCQNCSINQLCLPVTLADAEVEHLDNIVQRRKPYSRGELIFSSGEQLKALYVVRSGCLKSYTISKDGIEQITGFHLPGEIIGLDAIHTEQHPSFSKAIETSSICNLPYQKLDQLADLIPGLRRQLLKVMSQEIQEDKELFLLLNNKSADERLAAFLINLSQRYANRGLSRTRFNLIMTRGDIGNYLGMAFETVSRLFRKLQNLEFIRVKDKEVEIINLIKLSEMAGTDCHY